VEYVEGLQHRLEKTREGQKPTYFHKSLLINLI
jgi:hypothetical protein